MYTFILLMDQLSLFRTAVSVTAFKNVHFGTLDSQYYITILAQLQSNNWVQYALKIFVGS